MPQRLWGQPWDPPADPFVVVVSVPLDVVGEPGKPRVERWPADRQAGSMGVLAIQQLDRRERLACLFAVQQQEVGQRESGVELDD